MAAPDVFRRLTHATSRTVLNRFKLQALEGQRRYVGDLPVKPNKHIEAW